MKFYQVEVFLDVVHDLDLEESLSRVVHDFVAQLGLGDVLAQLFDAGAGRWWAILVNDLKFFELTKRCSLLLMLRTVLFNI